MREENHSANGVAGSTVARPFLRWAGSKRSLLAQLREKFPARYTRYVEPFVGSACLFFHADPPAAVLSDLNGELIDTYRAVKANAEEVSQALEGLPHGKEEYYKVRSVITENFSLAEKAARFIYLNRFCFNGLYRTNLKGMFNVPYGSPKNYNVPSLSELRLCSSRLSKAELRSGDFEQSIGDDILPSDFFYLDPPYCEEGRRIFREYHPDSFSISDLDRLVMVLEKIEKAGAMFMVSYANSVEARACFSPWNVSTVNVQRNISGFAKHRRLAQELVITNY